MSRLSGSLAAILLAFAAACVSSTVSHPKAAPELTLTQSMDVQLAKQEAFPWSLKRPLVWADFKGEPPRSGGAAAETAYTLLYGARCTGQSFEFRVIAAFRPKESWVRPAILKRPADSTRALKHEQTHFDLAEVHARRMRRHFAELIAPCRVTTDNLSEIAERMVQEEHAAQEKYDADTDHSRVPAEQARWDKEVATQLSALVKYAR
jgi:hypothetical protein